MSIKRIRAVDRALLVIEVLSQSGSCSLTELRQKTGLDNAGPLRILGTMNDRGWVRQLIVEKRYELSHSLGDILGAEARAHPMAEIAVPILLELRQNPYSLPSDLCAIRGFGQFEIIESTRLRGPMAPGRTGLGLQPSLFQSAHGRVILAHMSDEMREKHIQAFLNRARKETSVGIILADWMQNWKSHVHGDMAFEKSYIGNPHLMNRPPLAQSRFQLSRGWNSRIA
jgi:IclR family mhp operon transcriptional activator